jgi:four helix bundle protein
MKNNIVQEKSYLFALRIIKLNQYLQEKKQENTISSQVLRSGTAIGALISEGRFAQSKADFISKMNIALKEASETGYWLAILKDSGYISIDSYNSIEAECDELIRILVTIVKNSKNNP